MLKVFSSSFVLFIVKSLTFVMVVTIVVSGCKKNSLQETPTPTQTAIYTSPINNSTFLKNSKGEIIFKAFIDHQRNILGILYVAQIEGDIPQDLLFTPFEIRGLQLVSQKIEDTENGKKLTLIFITPPGQIYIVTDPVLVLGKLEFTAPNQGGFSIIPDAEISQILETGTRQNLLKVLEPTIYFFGQ